VGTVIASPADSQFSKALRCKTFLCFPGKDNGVSVLSCPACRQGCGPRVSWRRCTLKNKMAWSCRCEWVIHDKFSRRCLRIFLGAGINLGWWWLGFSFQHKKIKTLGKGATRNETFHFYCFRFLPFLNRAKSVLLQREKFLGFLLRKCWIKIQGLLEKRMLLLFIFPPFLPA